MNERIADILGQAFDRCKKYDDEGNTGLVRTTEAFYVFAELIIQECLTAIDNTNIHHVHTSYDHNLVMATIEKSKMAVKEHFGM